MALLHETFFEAGQRAAQWYIDTSDCFFCNVDNAAAYGEEHEKHCTFHGVTRTDLTAYLATLPTLEVSDDDA